MRLRILDGCFVNAKGGRGNNVESDLRMEHSIRNRKDLIRGLGANKSGQAIENVCGAADCIASIVHKFDVGVGLKEVSGRHTKVIKDDDMLKIRRKVHAIKPFQPTRGRSMHAYLNFAHPYDRVNVDDLEKMMNLTVTRLARNLPVEGEEDAESDGEEEELFGLPDIL